MSGTPFGGTTRATGLSIGDLTKGVYGSNYQLEGLDLGQVKFAPGVDENKTTTQTALNKNLDKYDDYDTFMDELTEHGEYPEKYALHAIVVGIEEFVKLSPVFFKYTQLQHRPKNSRLDNFIVDYVDGFAHGQRCSSMKFKTLTEAKRFAKTRFLERGAMSQISQIYVDTKSSYRREIGKKLLCTMGKEEKGTMKSKPKTKSKSYLINPRYVVVVNGVMTDAEYEWM